jgi:hypothetical protein
MDNVDTGPLYAVSVPHWATKLGSDLRQGEI